MAWLCTAPGRRPTQGGQSGCGRCARWRGGFQGQGEGAHPPAEHVPTTWRRLVLMVVQWDAAGLPCRLHPLAAPLCLIPRVCVCVCVCAPNPRMCVPLSAACGKPQIDRNRGLVDSINQYLPANRAALTPGILKVGAAHGVARSCSMCPCTCVLDQSWALHVCCPFDGEPARFSSCAPRLYIVRPQAVHRQHIMPSPCLACSPCCGLPLQGIVRSSGFSAVEVFRKYLWYGL